jgi:hypothetical protein
LNLRRGTWSTFHIEFTWPNPTSLCEAVEYIARCNIDTGGFNCGGASDKLQEKVVEHVLGVVGGAKGRFGDVLVLRREQKQESHQQSTLALFN